MSVAAQLLKEIVVGTSCGAGSDWIFNVIGNGSNGHGLSITTRYYGGHTHRFVDQR
jgi:hypothetical protein